MRLWCRWWSEGGVSKELSGETPFGDQFFPERYGVGLVDVQYADRRPADWRNADQLRTPPPKVLSPKITAGMIKASDFACSIVDSGNVRAFVPVTPRTRERQVVELRLSPVLLGDDVIDVERPRVELLREPTILADTFCSQPHPSIKIPGYRHVQGAWPALVSARRALDWRMPSSVPTRMYSSSSSRSPGDKEPF